jgi:hypothetical protein
MFPVITTGPTTQNYVEGQSIALLADALGNGQASRTFAMDATLGSKKLVLFIGSGNHGSTTLRPPTQVVSFNGTVGYRVFDDYSTAYDDGRTMWIDAAYIDLAADVVVTDISTLSYNGFALWQFTGIKNADDITNVAFDVQGFGNNDGGNNVIDQTFLDVNTADAATLAIVCHWANTKNVDYTGKVDGLSTSTTGIFQGIDRDHGGEPAVLQYEFASAPFLRQTMVLVLEKL